ncbi:MAG TPA: GNAT family N-acetyltransferase [Plantibacter sp.]|uniref:GNAT family N-acetyltransferase n=1 Tax=unclassified Plantibacter TaxID=2624265 RepID=UPI002CB00C0D|nr:GNAT family N-acetyltransferase [Plantibacter sp.]
MPHIVRTASSTDLDYLLAHDRHVTAAALRRCVEEGRVLLLEERGEISGWLRWSLFWDEIPFLNMIFLSESCRGAGLGTQLLDVWEADMLKLGHARVLTSTVSNERSQNLYRRRGYADSGVLLLPGEIAELLLVKELSAVS